jgi:RNA polymerase sigma-70 factor (ECF subfamily)
MLSRCVLSVANERDPAAFDVLFSHFAPRLKTYFMRSGTVKASVAEELAQDTMLLVWRKATLFNPAKASASTWIFAIARNIRVDRLRSERTQVTGTAEISVDLADIVEDGSVANVEDLLAAAGREVRLRQAIRTLPNDQVRVLELAYFSDQSHAAIAGGLGIPLGTVKSRLKLALLRLRTAFQGEERT